MKIIFMKLLKGIGIFLALAGVFVWLHWHGIEWGTLRLSSPGSITVTGMADGSQVNKEANFQATVSAENKDKETAIKELTENSNKLIAQLKTFGIPSGDIKTQNLSVYEYESPVARPLIYPELPVNGEKVWRASNTLDITVKDISRISELSTLLFSSGATDVYGPNFTAGDTLETEKKLLAEALKNAEEKAASMLVGTNQRIRKIVQIQEGYGGYTPMYKSIMPMAGGGVAEDIALEPGTQNITKTVTVTFEIGK